MPSAWLYATVRLLPAGAGVILRAQADLLDAYTAPRRRGGDPSQEVIPMRLRRCSPQARG